MYNTGQGGVMETDGVSENNFQRLICDCADELRDYWLSNQSARAVKEIMSLSISQQRMMRKVWRMNTEQPDGVMLKELAEKLGKKLATHILLSVIQTKCVDW